jgi:hypothetical protein
MKMLAVLLGTTDQLVSRVLLSALFGGGVATSVTPLVAAEGRRQWPPNQLTYVAKVVIAGLAAYAAGVSILLRAAAHRLVRGRRPNASSRSVTRALARTPSMNPMGSRRAAVHKRDGLAALPTAGVCPTSHVRCESSRILSRSALVPGRCGSYAGTIAKRRTRRVAHTGRAIVAHALCMTVVYNVRWAHRSCQPRGDVRGASPVPGIPSTRWERRSTLAMTRKCCREWEGLS